MQTTINLKEMERKAYLSYHEDGLVDLVLGMVVLLFGIGMLTDHAALAPVFCAMAYPVWLAAKKVITEKRLGYVEFSPERKQKERKGLVFLFLLGCLALLVSVIGYLAVVSDGGTSDFMKERGILLLGPLFAAMISSVGLVLGVVRLHVYSGIVILGIALMHLLKAPEPYGVIVPGLMIVVSGLVFLVRFLRRYPVPKMETDD